MGAAGLSAAIPADTRGAVCCGAVLWGFLRRGPARASRRDAAQRRAGATGRVRRRTPGRLSPQEHP